MRISALTNRAFLFVALYAALGFSHADAQFGGGGGGGGLGGGGGAGGGGFSAGGVVVDADGVLSREMVQQVDPRLAEQRKAEAVSRLNGDLAKPSKLRKISLTRLEDAVEASLAEGGSPDEAMRYLAGLTRIDYVFCYPPEAGQSEGEIILAGPAEPWVTSPSGRVLGVSTESPVLELQDLLAALRAFPANESGQGPLIYCSIDPTAEGLARMQQFLASFGRQATPAQTQYIVKSLQEALGPQVVTVGGMPADTHFAQVLVEADYQMKLIGIGLESAPVKLKSYVARANAAMVSRNALQRWYFVPDYERLMMSEDGLAAQIVGDGVKLIGEDEMVSRDGRRRQVGATNRASNGFVSDFTKSYDRIAQRSPVYAQLRNCIDLAVTAALIRTKGYYQTAAWTPGAFASEETYPIQTFNAPERVATAVNSLWKGSMLMTPVGGGVQIGAAEALNKENVRYDEDGALSTTREAVLATSPRDRWWWD
ncbi:DUF1598 domain-containing protein [Botrimarina hoheduenensis]|uniref:DUF1598 domain-containing protein n=1 Tax=Botrimarina hoheduenensis TaxID=2528000 RepID=A0A5C5WBJ7_9BACT|nr:DUF1598 domain-containing protein [Botrimarina hoheduenensis]TWT47593.1 hypothetical protein Pla111_12080 [Botrimarina hoheduenensis]